MSFEYWIIVRVECEIYDMLRIYWLLENWLWIRSGKFRLSRMVLGMKDCGNPIPKKLVSLRCRT
jgi:hypothetical protein